MSQRVAHRWEPITDYEDPPSHIARAELRELAAVWEEQREALAESAATREFNDRLRREWAIETGLIERVYTLDRGITRLLVERGIDASLIPHEPGGQSPEEVAAILRDHEATIDGLFAFVRGDRSLGTSYVKELHAQLTRNQQTAPAVNGRGRRTEARPCGSSSSTSTSYFRLKIGQRVTRLPDISLEHAEELAEKARTLLDRLRSVDPGELSHAEQVTLEGVRFDLGIFAEAARFYL